MSHCFLRRPQTGQNRGNMNFSAFTKTKFWLAVGITLACSLSGKWISGFPGFSLIGHLVLALLLGMAFQIFPGPTQTARESTGFIANKFLRLGIILIGFKLNLASLLLLVFVAPLVKFFVV